MSNVNIRHRVTQIPQPQGSYKCWAACAAMILHRRGPNADAIVNAVVDEARRSAISLDSRDSLEESGVAQLAAHFGLFDWRAPAGSLVVDPTMFATSLRHGAAIALGARQWTGPGEHHHHAVVVDGLRGDTDAPVHILLHGVDPLIPAGGGGFERSVTGFLTYLRITHLLFRQ